MRTRLLSLLGLVLCLALASFTATTPLAAGEGEGVPENHNNHLGPRMVCCMPAPLPDQPPVKAFLPLRHTDVTGTITGMIAEVTVKQEYFNPLADRLEAIYVFPLPDNAAVHGLKITIKDRTIVGEIKTTEAARATYQEARNAGQTAALVEQNRTNIFTASVANIPPGEAVTVELTYFQTLTYDDGRFSFHFPMVVAPRYLAASDTTTTTTPLPPVNPALPDGPVATPPVAEGVVDTKPLPAVGYLNPADKRIGNITLHINLDAGVALASVTCPTHEITLKQTSNTTAVVDLAKKDEIPNKDFVLEYKVTNTAVQAAILAHKPKDSPVGYFLLMIVPKEEYESEEILPKEMIYIIDHSGSMRGEKMNQAKLALKSSLHQLNKDDTFTIVPFSSNVEHFSDATVPFDQAHLDSADQFLAGINANGGTEILRPMQWALSQTPDAKRLRIVCFLTDGEVSNDDQVVRTVQAEAGNSRVYTFGIGNGVNRWMLRKMAEFGHGGFETILPGEDMEEKIARFNDRTSYPVLRDVAANYGGLDVKDTYPATMPDLFTAQPILLLGTYTKGGEYKITISGKTADGVYSNDLKVNLPDDSNDNPGLPVIWARARVEDLNDRMVKAADPKPLQDEIRALGLQFSLATDYTSFVVVEKKQVEKEGKLVTEDVEVPMPAGWAADELDKDSAGESMRRADSKGGAADRFGGGARKMQAAQANGAPSGAGAMPAPATASGPGAPPPAPASPAVDGRQAMQAQAGAQAPPPSAPDAGMRFDPMGSSTPKAKALKDQDGLARDAVADRDLDGLTRRIDALRERRDAAFKRMEQTPTDKPAANLEKNAVGGDGTPGTPGATGATGEYLGDRQISDDQSEMLADVLRALAREQDVDGLWKDPDHDKTDFAMLERSTIAILCYHRAGQTTRKGKFKSQMERAVDGLIKAEHADGGYMLDADGGVRLQAEVALTLVEIAAARNKDSYRAAALKAIEALLKLQRADGMFPATLKGDGDKMTTAFALETLRRATTLTIGAYAAPADLAEKALGAKSSDLLKELARSAVKANPDNASNLDRITGMAFYLTFGE